MIKRLKKYKGFSLVEMLFTMILLTTIMLMVASTLNTVIKVSQTTNSKNQARADMTYIMDYIERVFANTELSDIYVFNSSRIRNISVDGVTEPEVVTDPGFPDLSIVYNAAAKVENIEAGSEPEVINEVHVKLYGYSDWTCIGFFKDITPSQEIDEDGNPREYGYLVRAVHPSNDVGEFDHEKCFGDDATIVPLHSFMVDVSDFSIEYIKFTDDKNSMFIVNATVEPLFWPMRNTSVMTKKVTRQSVISTQALTWY